MDFQRGAGRFYLNPTLAGHPARDRSLLLAGDVFQFEIKRGGVAILRPQHINDALPAAFQADAVQLTVAGGFNIYRNPLERRTIVGMRFQTGINDSAIVHITLDPHR